MPFSILQWVFHQRWLTRFRRIHDRLMKGFAHHADRGNADAQELYGFLLLHRGQDASSRSAGARYLMMCVGPDRPKVCWQMYKVFEKGDLLGFKADESLAKRYYEMARDAGHPLAQESIAIP